MKISATIITYNEQRNIARAIESLRCCDEVVIVDSGSVFPFEGITAVRFHTTCHQIGWAPLLWFARASKATDCRRTLWVRSIPFAVYPEWIRDSALGSSGSGFSRGAASSSTTTFRALGRHYRVFRSG
jgi:hypothetical protein